MLQHQLGYKPYYRYLFLIHQMHLLRVVVTIAEVVALFAFYHGGRYGPPRAQGHPPRPQGDPPGCPKVRHKAPETPHAFPKAIKWGRRHRPLGLSISTGRQTSVQQLIQEEPLINGFRFTLSACEPSFISEAISSKRSDSKRSDSKRS